MSYRGHFQGSYGLRRLQRVHTRKVGVVSQAEQDRRFREASEYESTRFLPKHGSVKARLAMHKLYGETH